MSTSYKKVDAIKGRRTRSKFWVQHQWRSLGSFHHYVRRHPLLFHRLMLTISGNRKHCRSLWLANSTIWSQHFLIKCPINHEEAPSVPHRQIESKQKQNKKSHVIYLHQNWHSSSTSSRPTSRTRHFPSSLRFHVQSSQSPFVRTWWGEVMKAKLEGVQWGRIEHGLYILLYSKVDPRINDQYEA